MGLPADDEEPLLDAGRPPPPYMGSRSPPPSSKLGPATRDREDGRGSAQRSVPRCASEQGTALVVPNSEGACDMDSARDCPPTLSTRHSSSHRNARTPVPTRDVHLFQKHWVCGPGAPDNRSGYTLPLRPPLLSIATPHTLPYECHERVLVCAHSSALSPTAQIHVQSTCNKVGMHARGRLGDCTPVECLDTPGAINGTTGGLNYTLWTRASLGGHPTIKDSGRRLQCSQPVSPYIPDVRWHSARPYTAIIPARLQRPLLPSPCRSCGRAEDGCSPPSGAQPLWWCERNDLSFCSEMTGVAHAEPGAWGPPRHAGDSTKPHVASAAAGQRKRRYRCGLEAACAARTGRCRVHWRCQVPRERRRAMTQPPTPPALFVPRVRVLLGAFACHRPLSNRRASPAGSHPSASASQKQAARGGSALAAAIDAQPAPRAPSSLLLLLLLQLGQEQPEAGC